MCDQVRAREMIFDDAFARAMSQSPDTTRAHSPAGVCDSRSHVSGAERSAITPQSSRSMLRRGDQLLTRRASKDADDDARSLLVFAAAVLCEALHDRRGSSDDDEKRR